MATDRYAINAALEHDFKAVMDQQGTDELVLKAIDGTAHSVPCMAKELSTAPADVEAYPGEALRVAVALVLRGDIPESVAPSRGDDAGLWGQNWQVRRVHLLGYGEGCGYRIILATDDRTRGGSR